MRQTFHILAKDIRSLWPAIAVVEAVIVLAGMRTVQLPRGGPSQGASQLLGFFSVLAVAYLTISVIHQEPLTSDRAYWLARPIDWRALLTAKAFFLVVFLVAPHFAFDVASLAANGVPVWPHLTELLANQVFHAAWFILPAVALGLVTSNLTEAAVTAVAVSVALVFTWNASQRFPELTGAGWVLWVWAAVVLYAAVVAAALLMYRGRFAAWTRVILLITAAVLIWSPHYEWWGAAWKFQKMVALEADTSKIRITFDSGRAQDGLTGLSARNFARFAIPLAIDGLPEGTLLNCERAEIRTENKNGSLWRRNYIPGDLMDPAAGTLPRLNAPIFYLYGPVLPKGVSAIQLRLALTLLGPARRNHLVADSSVQPAQYNGFCWDKNGEQSSQYVACIFPFRIPPWIRAASIDAAEMTNNIRGPYAAFPVDGFLWQSIDFVPAGNMLETREAVAHFERIINITGAEIR